MAYSQASIIATSIVFPTIGFVLVGIRFWMRYFWPKTFFGMDDWMILSASILVLAMAAVAIVDTFVGLLGMDGRQVEEWHEVPQKKLDYSILAFEKPAYGAIKLSVLLFYRRIFTVRSFRILNDILIGIIVAWTLAFMFADIFSCGAHPEANWDPLAKAMYSCINLFVMLLIFAITDVLTDIAIMWMPYPQIKRLQMRPQEKWALSGIFLMGTIDLVLGIVRLGFIVANQTLPAIRSNFNPPEQTAPTFWTIIEVGIGVIAANLPALAPLYRDRARLGSLLASSFRRKRSPVKRQVSTVASVLTADTGAHISPDKEARLVGDRENRTKHASLHVGAWDQFERTGGLSDEPLTTSETQVDNDV